METKHGDPSVCFDLLHNTMSIVWELMELKNQTQFTGMSVATQQSLKN